MNKPYQTLIARLRSASVGRDVWRVHNKDNKSYCIQFEAWERAEANQWWDSKKDGEFHKNNELALVRIYSSNDRLMQEASRALEQSEREAPVASQHWTEEFESWLDQNIEVVDDHYRIHPDATTAHLPLMLKMVRGKLQKFKRQGREPQLSTTNEP